MVKKIPISFNDQEEETVKELADLIGIAGVYGDFPKALKFGINLALSSIKNPGKVYTNLNDDETALYFSSILKAEKKARLLAKVSELQKEAQKV